MKRLLFTFHYGSEMDIVSKAVDEKMSTTLRVPRPSPILVLTTAQRCLTSQIGRDAVLSTCKAVDEKMSTTLRVPRPSPILVLTTAQRCLTSQIGRDAVLSTWYDRRHLLCE
ncbi:hypothetical protein T4A_2285 [Trichinella pseudospiralis]|uniref:Uncharacterized protein n=1 Tax=Trichinella pseudospiralis TaxID=6337 RepID=A0A0V1F0T4_TRIPS|nr:hypothetical protein T4A_2285 [Trichinella pseudospiralis]